MDNQELVKALRHCGTLQGCDGCIFKDKPAEFCREEVHLRAANTIAKLEVENEGLRASSKIIIDRVISRQNADKKTKAPLTLKELQEITGEPVWIIKSNYPVNPKWEDGRYFILPEIVEQKVFGGYDEYYFFGEKCYLCDYGKTWLAYPHKFNTTNTSSELNEKQVF